MLNIWQDLHIYKNFIYTDSYDICHNNNASHLYIFQCLATLGVPVPTLAVMGRRAVLGAGSSALTVRLPGGSLIVRLDVLVPNIIMLVN